MLFRSLLYLFIFYLRFTYLISKKPFEFGRVFDKWKIWRREREGERERETCMRVCVWWGGRGLCERVDEKKVKEKKTVFGFGYVKQRGRKYRE